MGPTWTRTPTPTYGLTREDRREDVGVSGDFPVQLATSRTCTTILADLSADTRAFPREDFHWGCARVHVYVYCT